jgi:hypothetical protein
MNTLNPSICAWFLLASFVAGGACQTLWFATAWSRRLAIPLDGGHTFRGRRVFGSNKTLRGFVVLVPACAASFALTAMLMGGSNPESIGLWPLSSRAYAALGGWAGLGFMLGELPNSFLKRQLDVEPGRAARGLPLVIQLFADRLDSPIAALAFVSLAVPTPLATWALVLVAGPFAHLGFSIAMCRLGVKTRLA